MLRCLLYEAGETHGLPFPFFLLFISETASFFMFFVSCAQVINWRGNVGALEEWLAASTFCDVETWSLSAPRSPFPFSSHRRCVYRRMGTISWFVSHNGQLFLAMSEDWFPAARPRVRCRRRKLILGSQSVTTVRNNYVEGPDGASAVTPEIC